MFSHLQFPKFLLNSRSPLVTATSPLLGWHPFYRRYGANLPSSLAGIHLLRLGLLSLWYLCQISVRTAPRFSRAPGMSSGGVKPRLVTLWGSSHHYGPSFP